MNPGELTSRITIQHNDYTLNDLNEHVANWVDGVSLWASFHTIGSRELFFAQKVYAESTAVFIVRYRTGIDSTMRVKLGTRVFEISGTPYDTDGLKSMLTIPAKEVI